MIIQLLTAAVLLAAVPAKTTGGTRHGKASSRAKVTASAKVGPAESAHRRVPYVGAIVAEASSGKVLFSDGADNEAYPASVTKLMTALLVLEDVRAGKYALTDRVTATEAVYRSEASWVGLKAGQSMTVDDLLMALMVTSANDAAIALGVHSSGSVQSFVARMNSRAAELGMKRTQYFNPNGLPAPKYAKSFNRSTAADQLKLALHILKFPQILKYTSAKTATVIDGAGKPLKMMNHNRILRMDKFHVINPDGTEAVDGLKTGYINAGGSSIVLTGTRKGKRVVVVVLGSASSDLREEHAARLLSDALGAVAW